MKLAPIILATASLMGLTTCYADVCQYHFGSVTCDPGTVSSVTANGVATINGTTITNQLTVHGTLTATNAHINNINCSGSCLLNKSSISGNTIINGLLNASNTHFSQTITLNSNASILTASKAADIMVNVSGGSAFNSLCLESNTQTGVITFNAGTGIVYESGGSSATDVVNGKILKSACPQN